MNDLIGLEYQWGSHFRDGQGKTDCFQLVCEIRERIGLSDYSEKFAWAYESYTAESLKPARLARWLLGEGKRLKLPVHGAVALLNQQTRHWVVLLMAALFSLLLASELSASQCRV